MTDSTFWSFNIGHLLTIGSILVGLGGLHFSQMNVRDRDMQDRQEIKTKLDLIYNWFQNHIINKRMSEGD